MEENVETPTPAESSDSGQAEQGATAEQPEIAQDARNMAALCHILGLVGFIGPLVIWLMKKDDHEFIDDQGKEALNFQFSIIIGYVAALVLGYISVGVSAAIGSILMLLVFVANTVLVIIAALEAGGGIRWRYPVATRFLK
jgi:uncharacterized Tic20 family protein